MSADDEELIVHIRNHLTDGLWHDRCPWCLQRRRYGGDGTSSHSVRLDRAFGPEETP